MARIVRTTLAEQAYRELRSRILSGALRGGARLLPNELADDLGISPTPVKEACLRLAADGLVSVSSRRGISVRLLEADDVETVYRARMLLERGALDEIARRGAGGSFVKQLELCLQGHRDHASGGDLDDLARALEYDRAFHRLIVAEARNALVTEWHEKAMQQTHTVFVALPGRYGRSVDEHERLLDRIRAADWAGARSALDDHLERSLAEAKEIASRLTSDPDASARERPTTSG